MSRVEAETLADRYEQLRREYWQRVGSRGMAIFLDQGMCAWMRAWAEWACVTDRAEGLWKTNRMESQVEVPAAVGDGFRDELVRVVTAMALTTVGESTGCAMRVIRR
jgi:hypothetical protein